MEKSSVEELEEGELDFDGSFEEIYTPLERPGGNVTVPTKPPVESDLEENECSSSSDSDSSGDKGSRPKIRKNKKLSKVGDMPKNNNRKIWCNVLEAESVSSTLTDCNLDEFQRRIRGLVPYTRKYNRNCNGNNSDTNGGINSGKRNHDGNFVGDKKFFKGNQANLKKGGSKNILPLPESDCDSNEKLAKSIADKLNEVKEDLIFRAIEIAGKEKIISVFEETRGVEKSGGMLIMNGSRRRTSGGVFFYLLKSSDDIPQEQLKLIFQVDKQDAAAQKKKVSKQVRRKEETESSMVAQTASNDVENM